MNQLSAIILLVLTSLTAAEPEYRTWTDASGRHRIEAELLSVQGGKVFLKKRSGDAIVVPLEQLSPADRQFLADRSAGAAPRPAAASPASACVVLSQRISVPDRAPQVRYHPGVYIGRQASEGYVLSELSASLRPNRQREETTIDYEIVFGAGTPKTLRVAAQPSGLLSESRLAVWKVSSPSLPPTTPIANQAPSSGQSVKVYQLSIMPGETRGCLTARLEESVSVSDVARDEQGKLLQFELSCDTAKAGRLSLVVDESGRALGVVLGPQRSRRPDSPSLQSVLPLARLMSEAAPHFKSIRLVGKSWGRQGTEYRIEAAVHDPFGRVKAGRALVRREGAPGPGTPSQLKIPTISELQWLPNQGNDPTLARGDWTDPQPPDGLAVPKYVATFEYECHDGTQGRAAQEEVEVAMVDFEPFPYLADKTAPSPDGGMIITHDVPAGQGALPAPEGLTIPKSQDDRSDPAPRLPGPAGFEVSDLTGLVTDVNRPTRDDVMHNYCWSPNGDAFYYLGVRGVVHRIALPGLRRTHRIQLPSYPRDFRQPEEGAIACCSEGLAVLGRGESERRRILWMLDPTTLEVRRAIDLPPITAIAASPQNPYVYLPINGFSIFDARSGHIVARTKIPKDPREGDTAGGGHFRLSDDGKWFVIGGGGRGATHRCRVDEHRLIWEAALRGEHGWIDPSLPYAMENMAELLAGIALDGDWFGKQITRCRDDFIPPKHKLFLPDGGRFLAADPAGGLLLAGDVKSRSQEDTVVRALSPDLKMLAEFTVKGGRDETDRFVRFHPQGRQAAIATSHGLAYLKITRSIATDAP